MGLLSIWLKTKFISKFKLYLLKYEFAEILLSYTNIKMMLYYDVSPEMEMCPYLQPYKEFPDFWSGLHLYILKSFH